MGPEVPPITPSIETPFQNERSWTQQDASFRRIAIQTVQLQNAIKLRSALAQILADISLVKAGVDGFFKDATSTFADWEKQDPRGFAKYEGWKKSSMALLHCLIAPDFKIYPGWIRKEPLLALRIQLERLSPFTARALYEYGPIGVFEAAISEAISAIDDLFSDE